jgi:hypothetical protein
MIYEYALDPAILKDWGSFRPLADGFGFSRGRIIADYPNKKWLKSAYATIDAIPNQNVKKKFEIWLNERAKAAMSGRRRISANHDTTKTWFINALAEHSRGPFHAVISDQPPRENSAVLDYREADESHPLWRVNRQYFVARTAGEVGPKVGSLLVHAREIRFVDPYFKADPKDIQMMFGCLECFKSAENLVDRIELHVAGNKVPMTMVQYILRDITGGCPPMLPKMHVVRWKENYLHNRFILTDRGGISLGDSIKESDERPDQLTLLEDEPYKKWWDYHDMERASGHLMTE